MGSPAPRIGDVLADQYRVEGVLGKGGMGTVYAVTDVETGAPFAMKIVVDTKDGEHVTRFFREGRATMRVKSDHVVRVFNLGSIEGDVPYMVMERLEGSTLKELAEDVQLPESMVADFGIQACEGLSHAHAVGIVHRDVKPSNLFVLNGEDGHLKVLDFGISRMASLEDWERTATVTETNALLGSPHYVSPEQLQNPSGVDERADVWSLGVSMYYALSGELPFAASSLAELLVAVMSRAPIPLGSRCRVSPAMNAIVSRCLDRALDRRFRSASELALALAPHASTRWAPLARQVKQATRIGAPRGAAPQAPPRAPGDHTLTASLSVPPPDSAPDLVPLSTLDTRLATPASATTTDATITDATVTDATITDGRGPAITRPDPTGPHRTLTHPVLPAAPRRVELPPIVSSVGPPTPPSFTPIDRTRLELALDAAPQQAKPKRPWLGLGLVVGLLTTGLGAAFALRPRPSAPSAPSEPPVSVADVPPPPDPPATASASPPPPTVASQTSAKTVAAPQLELVADAPIAQVLRPAARRVIVEDGKALVTVNPFKNDLPIEVELKTGARAKGVARVGGPTTIHLVTAPRSTKPGPKPHPAAPPGNDLHKSPYE